MAERAENDPLTEEASEKRAEQLYQEFLQHPAFAKEIDPSKPLSEATLGLQALKYEDDDPKLCATNYKEEGNHYFAQKKYEVAIANYEKALELGVDDKQLNAVLLTNCATSNFYLKNYRKCINECKRAVDLNPNHMKIYRRAALAAKALGKPKECLEWCDMGLKVDENDEQLKKTLEDGKLLEKTQKSERRKQKAKEWGEMKNKEQTLASFANLLKGRGLRFEPDELLASSLPTELQVWEDEEKCLHWPIMFFYPENGNTDLLKDVVETSRLSDCMAQLFDEGQEPPSWDPKRLYTTSTVAVYFENMKSSARVEVPLSRSIKKAIQHPEYVIQAKLLTFVVISKASEKFYSSWVK